LHSYKILPKAQSSLVQSRDQHMGVLSSNCYEILRSVTGIKPGIFHIRIYVTHVAIATQHVHRLQIRPIVHN